jgi:hypothetical protein
MLIQIHSLLISVDFLDPSKVIPGLHSLESVPYATYQAHNISDRVIDFILKIFCLNVSYANVSVDGPGRYFLPSETTPVDYSADWAPEFSRHLKALSSPPERRSHAPAGMAGQPSLPDTRSGSAGIGNWGKCEHGHHLYCWVFAILENCFTPSSKGYR